MEGLRKDHKNDINGDKTLGPKLRPLCAANRAPNAALGGIVAKVVKAVASCVVEKNSNGEVISTEELKRSIEDQNKYRSTFNVTLDPLSIALILTITFDQCTARSDGFI